MLRTTRLAVLTAIILCAGGLYLRGARTTSQTGSWMRTGSMSSECSGACAAPLADGRVLITGGTSSLGALTSAEFFNVDGSFSSAAPMAYARSAHACVTLADNRVLVMGGLSNSGALNVAEIYDAASNRWTLAGNLIEARSGHTASRLPDGSGAGDLSVNWVRR